MDSKENKQPPEVKKRKEEFSLSQRQLGLVDILISIPKVGYGSSIKLICKPDNFTLEPSRAIRWESQCPEV